MLNEHATYMHRRPISGSSAVAHHLNDSKECCGESEWNSFDAEFKSRLPLHQGSINGICLARKSCLKWTNGTWSEWSHHKRTYTYTMQTSYNINMMDEFCTAIYQPTDHGSISLINHMISDATTVGIVQDDTAPWVLYSVDIKTKVLSQYRLLTVRLNPSVG